MMIRRTVMLFLLLLAACGRESGQPASDTPSPEATPQTGGRLVVALAREPKTLNPLLYRDAAATYTMGIMHRSLVRMDAAMQWQPSVADRWEWSVDGRTLDVHLRPGVKWSDGQPFGAQDIVRTYEVCRDEKIATPRRSVAAGISNVEAVDEENLRLTLAAIGAEPLRFLALDPLPAHSLTSLDPDAVEDWPLGRQPVVLGPYRLKSWTTNVRLVLERNPEYWGEPARLDEIELKIVPDAASQVLQLESGEVDVVIDVPGVDVDRLQQGGKVQIVPLTGRTVNYVVFNLHNPMFEDVRVRRAISYAIDRRALVDGVLDGRGEVGSSYLAPFLWCYDESIEADGHDPEEAALLLTQAGWTDTNGDGTRDKGGIEFQFELTVAANDPERENAAALLRRNLEDVGLSARIVMLEINTQIDRAMKDDFDATFLQLGSSAYPDPGPFLGSGGRNNFGHYASPEFDQLLEQAQSTADRDEALPSWQRLQRLVHEEKPVVVLYYPSQVVGLSARVQGATPTLISPFSDIEKWWVTP